MLRKWFLIMLLFSASFYYVSAASAAPSVTSISGVVTNGSSVTINGTSFGAGPTVHKWDDFEGGTHVVDSDVGAGPGSIAWNHTWATNHCKISNSANRTNSTQHCRSSFNTTYRGGIYMDYDGATPSPVYITWWWEYDLNGGPTSDNWKPHWPAGVGQKPSAPRVSMCYMGEGGLHAVSPNGTISAKMWHTRPAEGDWIRSEFFGIESSAGTSDGTIVWYTQWEEGGSFEEIFDYEGNLETRSGSTHWNRTLFGDYVKPLPSSVNLDIDFDDVYIANSRARVEIGNNATLANCTHREIQIPTAWSGNSITVTVNQGSFASCETAYLFVVDADGNVNTAGYPTRIVTGAGEPPCPPIGGRISK